MHKCVVLIWMFTLTCMAGRAPAQDHAHHRPIQELIDRAEAYGSAGDNQMAYQTLLDARRHADQTRNDPIVQITIERNLGEYARRLANLRLAKQHYQTAVALVQQQKDPDLYQLYQTYTSLGTLSWYASKLDSAAYFYEQAINVVAEIDHTALNTFYRRALLYNNVAGVYRLQGKTTKAIQTLETCITLLQKFLATDGYAAEKKNAIPLRFEAIDNLGGAYKELGNYSKTEQLLLYAYEQKQKHLPPDDPGVFISQLLLGQLYHETFETKKVLQYLHRGRAAIQASGSDYLFWDADACYTLALVYEKLDHDDQASAYYREADSLYHLAFGDSFDSFYLDFCYKYASFQAKNGQCAPALQGALRTLSYVTDAGNEHSLLPFYQWRNLAELSLQCHSFDQARTYARQASAHINAFVAQSTTLADSIRTEGEKAKALLLRVKADYALLANPDPATLKFLLRDLDEAMALMERKKRALTEQKDIMTWVADQKDLTDFVKQLLFALYEITGDRHYLLRGLDLHDGNLYGRMRLRMDYQNSLQFADVPLAILNEEKTYKDRMRRALQQDRAEVGSLADDQASLNDWHLFLQRLESEYPHYHQLRYAEKSLDLDRLQRLVNEGMTIVHYLFCGDELFAFVMNDKKHTLVRLETEGMRDRIQMPAEHACHRLSL